MEGNLIQYYEEQFCKENQRDYPIFADNRFEASLEGKDIIQAEREQGFNLDKQIEDLINRIDLIFKYIKDLNTNDKEEDKIISCLDLKKNKLKESQKVFRKEIDNYYLCFDYYSQILNCYKERYKQLGIKMKDINEKKMLIKSSVDIQLLIRDSFDNVMYLYNDIRSKFNDDKQFLEELFQKYHFSF